MAKSASKLEIGQPLKLLLAIIALLLAQPSAADDSVGDALPAWMSGAWERIDGQEWADEYWTPPKAGIMIGASRSGKGEKLTFWEHMRIVREADGHLAFWAIAADQKPVRFESVKTTSNEIVFENPDHDYPQRIRYWREEDVLRAEISLLDRSKAVQFLYGRIGG